VAFLSPLSSFVRRTVLWLEEAVEIVCLAIVLVFFLLSFSMGWLLERL
jgi:hypothetical protein